MTSNNCFATDPASFRDPSGHIVVDSEGRLFRNIMPEYERHYNLLVSSGVLKKAIQKGLLVKTEEVSPLPGAWKTLSIERIPFITYPYEWCFSQLKNAALLTLQLQQLSLEHGMVLKDATAFNVAFQGHKPIFIDTLSFEEYKEGSAWQAYGQFCRHFVAPLALMCYRSLGSNIGLRDHLDGFDLLEVSKLLPFKTLLKPGLVWHLHLHAKMTSKYSDSRTSAASLKKVEVSKRTLLNMVDSLTALISGFRLPKQHTEWGDYYQDTNYSDESFEKKKAIIATMLEELQPDSVLDLGANDGTFSALAKTKACHVVSPDIDPLAVEKHYRKLVHDKQENILPIVQNLTNPSPGIGWNNQERSPFSSRIRCHTGMALALIHHLAISNNIPLMKIAQMFASVCDNLILEFVPKEDSQVERLLSTRADIFPNYTLEDCIIAFEKYFILKRREPISNSRRTLLLFSCK